MKISDTPLDFTGKVAVITGAGQGIGRAYADLLASRGAKVVVNDLGTRMQGGGTDDTRARAAAEEIVAAGGEAAADASDISTTAGADALVATAIDTFGRLDIVINNAGIFSFDEFPHTEAELLTRMLDVHVVGQANVTRAAWPHLVESGHGRVVLTTSTSSLGGDNTVAYGTAKSGAIGLGRALAQVGRPLGIKVNLVAPQAMTRMMSSGMGHGEQSIPDIPDRAPTLVAPLVALLCHDTCPCTGELFVSGMHRVSRLAIVESLGYVHPTTDLTPEAVRDHWDSIWSLEAPELITDTMQWSRLNQTRRSEVLDLS